MIFNSYLHSSLIGVNFLIYVCVCLSWLRFSFLSVILHTHIQQLSTKGVTRMINLVLPLMVGLLTWHDFVIQTVGNTITYARAHTEEFDFVLEYINIFEQSTVVAECDLPPNHLWTRKLWQSLACACNSLNVHSHSSWSNKFEVMLGSFF